MRIAIALVFASIFANQAYADPDMAWSCVLNSPNKPELQFQLEREFEGADGWAWRVYVNGVRLDALCDEDGSLLSCSYGTHEEWATQREWSLGLHMNAWEIWIRNNDLGFAGKPADKDPQGWLTMELLRKRVTWGKCEPSDHWLSSNEITESVPF